MSVFGPRNTKSIGSLSCGTELGSYTRIPYLKNEVSELRQKLSEASKACEVLGNQIKKILE